MRPFHLRYVKKVAKKSPKGEYVILPNNIRGKNILNLPNFFSDNFTSQNIKNLEQKWHGVKPVLSVASGGVYPGIVDKMIKAMGNNIVIQAGGGVHGHPNGTTAGAIGMRQAIDACMKNIPLKKYAGTHFELKEALEKWKE